jgi:hypothetical protein
LQRAGNDLSALVEGAAYVGEIYSVGYEEALAQIHDYNRQQVGGIPALSFLLATRVIPNKMPDIRQEDASIILLRVIDHADLPECRIAGPRRKRSARQR